MSVAVSELLRFILQLLGDPAKAEEFSADPTGALAVAGLDGVTCAEVDAITPLVANAVPGVVSIAHHGPIAFNGGPSAPEPAEMIRQLVSNVEVNSFANSGVISNIWGADEVTQAFAADGGMVFGGDLGGRSHRDWQRKRRGFRYRTGIRSRHDSKPGRWQPGTWWRSDNRSR